MDGDPFAAPALRGWRATDEGLLLELEGATAVVAIAPDGAVRLRARIGSDPPPPIEAALGRSPWQPVRADPREGEAGGLWMAHEGPRGGVRVELLASPFSLRVSERDGAPVAVLEDLGLNRQGGGRVAFCARPGERFFGFGEKSGGLDKRGERLLMRNRDPQLSASDPRYLSIPFFLALRHDGGDGRACGVMLDAFGPSRFDVAASAGERVVMDTEFDGIDVTIFPGPKPADVLQRFTERVGRTPLPPRWALGHHQSRWSYGSEAEVSAVARELRARGIPTDAIHFDIDYMQGYRVFTWNRKRFPDPKQLLADLARQGFRAVVVIDPGVKADASWPVFRQGVERGVFCRRDDGELFTLKVWPKDSALPDFNRDEVRRWWGEQHRELVDAGVSGIWNDMNEPAGWSQELRIGRAILPLVRQNLSRVEQSDPVAPQRSVPHERVRNLYGLQQCRATREFLEAANPDRRPFVLTRAGYTGIQRFAAVWTGDNLSRWSHLRESIPMLLNLSLSGVAFCGADIGGFALSCTPELFARWIQLGALYPFARTHSIWLGRRQEPWRYGPRVEAIARDALGLRMQLMPYLYGLFLEAEETGAPVWRPLFYEFPDDPGAAQVEDQLMLGPSLLVAPVLRRGARERELYLPPGRWTSWWDDAVYVGPRRVRVPAPLERMPLFARGGSVLPTQSPVAHSGEPAAEPCVLEVFPGDDGSARLVEDDGETTAYRQGGAAETTLRLWHRAGGRLRLEIGQRHGSHPIAPRTLRVVVHTCPPPHGVTLNGKRVEPGGRAPGWSLEAGRLHIRFPDSDGGHSLEVDPAP